MTVKSFTPSVPTCFWCRKVKPLRLVTKWYSPAHDYSPCPDCDALMRRGVTVIEIKNEPNVPGQPCLHEKLQGKFPTGRWCVVQRAAAVMFGFPQACIDSMMMTTGPAYFDEIMGKQADKRIPTLAQIARQPQLLDVPGTMH